MITRRFVALVTLAVASQLGCSSALDTEAVETSEASYSTVANGLWALDGVAEHGDIELLQLARKNYASVVREAPAAAQAADDDDAPSSNGRAGSAPAAAPAPGGRAATGNLARAPQPDAPPALSLLGEEEFSVTERGDALTLTGADGRVLTYRRSYRLYCVPTDRSVEATVILELGKEPELVAVNGDGRSFPKAGIHAAAVRTDVLFRLHDYVIESSTGSGSVTVKLPWSDMGKDEVEGTIAMIGPPDVTAPTPISCERVYPSSYP
ncbi:MAG: hypothetical protein KF764_04485 [Labilithrix sp.]|nr:hypothetical protein [Labilithrix sp.]